MFEENKTVSQISDGSVIHDRYKVGKALRTSLRSRTYLGWDQQLEQSVVLKELCPQGISWNDTQWDTERSRFLQEAQQLQQLPDRTVIPRLLDQFTEKETEYLVLEYIPGTTLQQWVQEKEPMSVKLAMQWLMPLLISLGPLHDKALFHGSICPDNILLTDDGSVTLLEWGVNRYMGDGESIRPVLEDGYAAMEQYLTKGKTGTWTDVYSLCACFQFSVTGKRPASVVDRVLMDPEFQWDGPELTPDIWNAMKNGLQLSQKNRTSTATKLLHTFATFIVF